MVEFDKNKKQTRFPLCGEKKSDRSEIPNVLYIDLQSTIKINVFREFDMYGKFALYGSGTTLIYVVEITTFLII